MFCAKDERHSLLATLWFNIAHYALRPWPWILVGLASIILYPNLQDKESGYVLVMVNYLPPALRGLMLAGFAAAFMSTIGTNLNWGASYLVNDFYRRFVHKAAGERHYVAMSQVATVFLTIVSAILTYFMGSIAGAWKLLIVTGAGTGTVLILRWYWWRINAWSEVSAMIAAFVVSITLQLGFHLDSDDPYGFAYIMLITVGITTVVWLAATFLTAPEPMEKLVEFYRRVHPWTGGWAPVARQAPEILPTSDTMYNLIDWICGCVLIYGSLFGIGKIILEEYTTGCVFLAVGLAAGAVIYRDLSRRGWSSVMD
jgi:Na+/proline symporter